MTIGAGDRMPEATLFEMTDDGPSRTTVSEVFSGKTVALFGVPGAFTPTCHMKHMPGFVDNADALRQRGFDEVICITVNDPFVAGEWGRATGATNAGIRIICDPDAALTQALGLAFDGSAGGLGVRSQRYSAIVKDGVFVTLNREDDRKQVAASSAGHLLTQL